MLLPILLLSQVTGLNPVTPTHSPNAAPGALLRSIKTPSFKPKMEEEVEEGGETSPANKKKQNKKGREKGETSET